MRVQQALAAFAFPAYQYPPPKPHLTPSGECRSLFISGMHGKAENTPSTVSGSIIHTANSYALTGLEMETVRDNQGKKVRYEDTQRPLLLSTSGNAAHALLLLPQAAQLWARALYPQVEGCGLPAAVRARISSVEASLTMCPALAHLHICADRSACGPRCGESWRVQTVRYGFLCWVVYGRCCGYRLA